jgi:hypothetical protein
MKIYRSTLIVAAGLISLEAAANCEMPSLVGNIPDGATATEDELLATQAEVETYVEAMDRYIACSNAEIDSSDQDASADFLYWMSARVESARAEADAVARKFNDEVNAFRAARQAPAIRR